MEILRQSSVPIIQSSVKLVLSHTPRGHCSPRAPVEADIQNGGRRKNSPVVAAACSLTALRSLMKAFSVLCPVELARRRWTTVRAAGARSWAARRGARRNIWRWGNIVEESGEFESVGGGGRSIAGGRVFWWFEAGMRWSEGASG